MVEDGWKIDIWVCTLSLMHKKGWITQILSCKCRHRVVLPDPPKWHVILTYANVSWKCLECWPDISSNSVIRTMPDNMTCCVGTMSANMSADSFGHKEKMCKWRLSTIPSTHCPPIWSPNHDKPLAASGLAVFGSAASSLASSGSVGCHLAILNDCFGFGCCWCCGFAAAGCVVWGFAISGLASAGFEALGWWNQVWQCSGWSSIRYIVLTLPKPDNFQLVECKAGKPYVGKATGSSGAISDRGDNQPILLVNQYN